VNALDHTLVAALDEVARAPHLLVACDYDGTLAPIVDDPNRAVPLPEAIDALRKLANLPNTAVAVVSSRALRDLATLSRLPGEVMLVGSHGIEFDVTFEQTLKGQLHERKAKLLTELKKLTKDADGVRLEVKPAGVAVHTRMADQATAERIEKALHTTYSVRTDIYVTTGKKVVDLAVVPRQKQVAVGTLRERVGATAVLFLGDDTADEDVFRSLRSSDVSIKVGLGVETDADHQIADPRDTVTVLTELAAIRSRWIHGEKFVPIERHSMLSNGQTVAVLTPDARVTWFCQPRPDSAPVFADLLGGPAAGHFSIVPVAGEKLQGQRYLDSSMTVETRWNDLTVTDWLDTRPGDDNSRATCLVRLLEGTALTRIEFAPRPNFGKTRAHFKPVPDGLLITVGAEPSALWSPGLKWTVVDDVATAEVDLSRTGPVLLDLRCGTDDLSPPSSTVEERLVAAQQPWQDWAAKLNLPATAHEQALRSALTLRALWHQPTGAILAAATTSLPETIGGSRNWDYRYCWLRDSTMTARELVALGSLEEAESLLGWIQGCIDRTGGHPERLRPIYSIDGSELATEAVIDTLPGYRASRPVRINNGAESQVQLDVFGPVVDLIAAVASTRGQVHDQEWHIVREMVLAVERGWAETDSGIWEPPIDPRHHVHSKVMCWWTVQRALDVAKLAGRSEVTAVWERLRDEIAGQVLERGWNAELQTFTESYDFNDVDAAILWIGLTGLVSDDDPRFRTTLLAVERRLRHGSTVYRYKWDDALPGREGGFHICTSWMIEAYLRTGRHVEAKALFKQYLEMLGPTGLMPEMYDPETETSLGNHPQAYSHLGLIRCALLFDKYRAPALIPGQTGREFVTA
jgi:trehalose-phosphatase